MNSKINPPYLETKKGKLCLHAFKYLNCHSDYQVDSNQYLYSNSSQSALKYLKDTEVDLDNVLLTMGNFNIRDCL